MPKSYDRCVREVKKKNPKANAYAICSVSTGWVRKKGGGWTKKRKKKK